MRPNPLIYAENPMATPLSCVGYSSPAKGYIMRNDADIADFESKNSMSVDVMASGMIYK